MTTLDLKDAYLSVPVHKDSQKFLQFLWRDKCYAFQGLCFGLNTAPRIFTKLLKPVAAFLRKRGVRMILYLDDFLVLGSTYQEAQSHTALAVSLLESLGFTINREKSRLIPTQIITFLGFVIDSTVETLSLPQEKVVKVRSLCMKATVTPTMSARQIASLLGTLESCRPAIWQGPLHFRYLQIRMIQALHVNNQNFDVFITLDHNSLEELRWWVSNINFVNGSPIRPPAPTLFITTDASQDGMGRGLRKSTHKRALVSQRTHPAHKRIRAQGCLSCPKVLSKETIPQGGMPENGQHNGSSPCKQQRRYPLTLPLSTHIGTLAMVPGEEHHDISSARTRQVEHHCRLRVEGVQRQQRVEDRPSNDFPISEGVQNRPVCLSPIHPTSSVRQLASGSRGTACGCVDNGLGTLQGLRLSTLQSDSSRPKQTVSGQSRHHISGTHLASSTMVATTTESPGRATCPPPELQTPPEGPSRPSEDSSNVPQTTLSRVSCLRGQYQTMGIPDNVTEILLSASRPSTRKTYQSAWRRWSGWCVKRKTDPLSAPLTDILLYLTEYFNSGAAYRSVNVARSAISTSHTKLNGLPVGQNPLVIQLLKGMFNNRPPKPRYSHTWEVSLVTTYLASLGSNRSLSLQQLSWKLAMLFSLTCPERVSALTKLDLRHCRILPDGVEFILSSPRKRGTADQLPKAFFARFPSNSKLCPVETLRCYLKATRSVRPAIPSSKPDPLFIS